MITFQFLRLPPGRGTTEQVLTMKLLAEKAITSCDYTTQILMMDMSKAFDTVRRSRPTIIEDLKAILNEDELHLIKILIKAVKLAVRIENKTEEAFSINIGTPTLYPAKGQKPDRPEHLLDHDYASTTPQNTIPLQYADDIC